MPKLTLVMAQMNTHVGDIDGNTERVLKSAIAAVNDHSADVIVFPELTLCGYPPEDLLLRASIQKRTQRALEKILAEAPAQLVMILGYPKYEGDELFNMAGVVQGGKIIAEYKKQCLPNYQVFDEKRYFSAGHQPCVVDIMGVPTAITVCEDIWEEKPMRQAKLAGAKWMVNLNASPFHTGKSAERLKLLSQRSIQGEMPIVYVNSVGGQDELVFDGGSFVIDAQGHLKTQAPFYQEGLFPVSIELDDEQVSVPQQALVEPQSDWQSIYDALVLGVRDYVNKNGFKGVVLGLSGGIDSALTLAVAVDALGADRVEAVMMPFRYTSDLSKSDAADQAARMGVRYQSLSIEPMYEAFIATLAEEFKDTERDTTEENLQARCRGVLLMAISNKKGYLVLTTGNKSEMAVGYSTLYGDMAGGFDVLKDVPKTWVFALARYRNEISPVIPETVITRPPSAELSPDQKDEDSLPPYEVLDQILSYYVEQDWSAEAIIAEGFDADQVNRVIRLVDINEYKRRQAPVGARITQRGFGRDRRYPITNGWKLGD